MKLQESFLSSVNDIYGFDLRVEDSSERLYVKNFGVIPSRIEVDNFITQSADYNKVFSDIITKYDISIDDYYINRQIYQPNSEYYDDESSFDSEITEEQIYSALFHIKDKIYVIISNDKFMIFYQNSNLNNALQIEKELLSLCEKNKKEDKQSNIINLLSQQDHKGLTLKKFNVNIPNTFNIEDNYNDDFSEINDIIIDRLETPNDKGIVLLYGVPGSGKSSYLKYLCSATTKKKIFVPPDLAHQVSSPSFIPFLIKHQNSILFIEDAENIIEERQGGNNQAVSNLLNISDGLLSDCLKIQIVCTFNADINKIDKALLRKGRLIAKYDFKALSVEKSNNLLKKIGKKYITKDPIILTDIYNFDEKTFKEETKQIGFNVKK